MHSRLQKKTLLWEVSGSGISSPSYLFGTIHLMCADELKMPDIVKGKFDSSKQLFLEIDMDDPNNGNRNDEWHANEGQYNFRKFNGKKI